MDQEGRQRLGRRPEMGNSTKYQMALYREFPLSHWNSLVHPALEILSRNKYPLACRQQWDGASQPQTSPAHPSEPASTQGTRAAGSRAKTSTSQCFAAVLVCRDGKEIYRGNIGWRFKSSLQFDEIKDKGEYILLFNLSESSMQFKVIVINRNVYLTFLHLIHHELYDTSSMTQECITIMKKQADKSFAVYISGFI